LVIPADDNQVHRFGSTNCLFTPIQNAILAKYEKSDNNAYKKTIKTMINKMNGLASEFTIQGATPELI
jgi:hypothetical protein